MRRGNRSTRRSILHGIDSNRPLAAKENDMKIKTWVLSIAVALAAVFGVQEAVAKNPLKTITPGKHHHQKKHKTHGATRTAPNPEVGWQVS